MLDKAETISDLWCMSPERFNQWRREHDLPRLLSYLKLNMPHFPEWLESQGITDQDFLELRRPSQLFIGERTKHLIKAKETEKGDNRFFVSDLSGTNLHIEQVKMLGFPLMEPVDSREFSPYFFWLRNRTGTPYFRTPGSKESERSFSKGFACMKGHGEFGHIYSQAFLFRDYELLKLGSVTIKARDFNGRNLDFVDLDGLQVKSGGRDDNLGNPRIAFSSCKKMSFVNCNRPFVTFENCALERFEVINSSMQDLHFIDCRLIESRFSGSELRNLRFIRTSASPLIQDCEVSETSVIERHRDDKPGSNAALFKSLRTAAQQRGQRGAAGKFFYCERKEEMLGIRYGRLFPYDPSLPRRKYSMPLHELKERVIAGQYDKSALKEWSIGYIIFFLQSFTTALSWFHILSKVWRMTAEGLDWLLWGFGERPARVLAWVVGSLIAFALYLVIAKDQDAGTAALCAMNALNGSTCPELVDFGGKVTAAAYGVLGIIFFGLLLAGFSNRNRY